MNDTALPTYEELSDGMDRAMQRGMVAAMSGDEDGRRVAMGDMRIYAQKIKDGEYK